MREASPMPNQSENNFVGIDIAAKTMHAVMISEVGKVKARRDAEHKAENIISEITNLVAGFREAGPIKSVGVGIPGLVNRETDQVLISTGLPSIVRDDIHSELMKATGLRFELENDANAAAYGEYQAGAGRGARDLFYIGIGNAVGGAIIIDGKLWIGASGCAGEVGHITIDTEGSECQCGNTGCLETVASAPNIVRRANERLNRDSTSSLSKLAMNKDFTADDMAREAMEGDDFAMMMIERTGKYIGTGVASIINLLNIERIVLGGGVMQAGDLILKPIIEEARKRAVPPCFEATHILAAALGAYHSSI